LAINISHSAKSDIGLKRTHNEDRFLADPLLRLYVVCDGMGGGNAGEVASAMAIDTLRSHLQAAEQNADFPFVGMVDGNVSSATNRLASAMRAANEAIHRASWTNPAYAGMGTTMVAIRLCGNLLSIAHVGDSRLYLIRHGQMQALTTDHSWVAEQVQQGLLTEAEAERSPKRNIVTRAIGVERTVEVDVAELPVIDGDRFLLCSDGLTRGVRPAEILRAIEEGSNMTVAIGHLVEMANRAGGEDNTTVLLVAIQGNTSNRLWQRFMQDWFPKAS
jgi:protein phosphatase